MRLYVLLKQDALQASKPPEENGLSLSHWRFAVFTYSKYSWNNFWRGNASEVI